MLIFAYDVHAATSYTLKIEEQNIRKEKGYFPVLCSDTTCVQVVSSKNLNNYNYMPVDLYRKVSNMISLSPTAREHEIQKINSIMRANIRKAKHPILGPFWLKKNAAAHNRNINTYVDYVLSGHLYPIREIFEQPGLTVDIDASSFDVLEALTVILDGWYTCMPHDAYFSGVSNYVFLADSKCVATGIASAYKEFHGLGKYQLK